MAQIGACWNQASWNVADWAANTWSGAGVAPVVVEQASGGGWSYRHGFSRRRRAEVLAEVIEPLPPAQQRVVRRVAQDDDAFVRRLHEQFDAHDWQWTRHMQAMAQRIAAVLQDFETQRVAAERAETERAEQAAQAQLEQEQQIQIQRRRRRNAVLLALLH